MTTACEAIADRAVWVDRLVAAVERSPGSGDFVADDRLLVDEVTLGSDGAIGSASVRVRLDDAFDLFAAREAYSPERRLLVWREGRPVSTRTVLFDGYPLAVKAAWDGRRGREDASYSFEAQHLLGQLGRLRECQVFGRRMRSATIEDGLISDPGAYADQSVLVDALSCVFNAKGMANQAAEPLVVVTADGQTRRVPIFTYDGDPDAVAWTAGAALRYLAHFYMPVAAGVDAGNVFSATASIVGDGASDGVGASGLTRLGQMLVDVSCEGSSLLDALVAMLGGVGAHVTCDTTMEGDAARTALRVWAAGDGASQWLHLARGGRDAQGARYYDAPSKSARAVLRDNDTHRAALSWNWRSVRNTAVVIGDVKWYEVTVPLVPGWAPEDDLDDVPAGSRSAAKLLALTPFDVEDLGEDVYLNTWYQKYHRSGSHYREHQNVARRWVLNEHGRYDAATYNRNVPFNNYAPFDFSTVLDESIYTPGSWTRRPRRLRDPITIGDNGLVYPLWVQISFDGGSTWQYQASSVSALTDEVGVFFSASNPTTVRPLGSAPEEQNLWYAIIDQTFRVRVTGLIEADARLSFESDAREHDAPTWRRYGEVVRATQFGFATRQGTTDELGDVNPDGDGIERDDAAALAAFARTLVGQVDDGCLHVAPALPGFDVRLAIGDVVMGVRGRDLSFETPAGDATAVPIVVGKRYRCGADRLHETELVLICEAVQ